MIIGIDCRFWTQTGIGRYTRNLVTNLSKLDKKNNYVLFVRSQDLKSVEQLNAPNFKIVKANIPWHGVLEQLKFPGVINRSKVDLMHFPYFSVPIFYNKPFVITLHDLIINSYKTGRASTLPYPIYLAKRAGYSVVLASAIARADKIIVPSLSVKTEVLLKYPNTESAKVINIYEGGFDNTKKDTGERVIQGRYILRVGNYYPHKNVETLITAFHEFLFDNYDNHDVKLVLVGVKDYFSKRISSMVDDLLLTENVIFLDATKDTELINLYKNAALTVVPSLMEGFSLTGLEALSLASPLLASDIPVHKEVFSTAAIYCNPHDAHDIKHKISHMLSLSEDKQNELIKEGLKQSQKYSWQKMATQTLALYESTKM